MHDATQTKILVIDDEKRICMIVERLLRDEGHIVKLAFDGKAGLDSVETFLPDIILLDLKMPEMDGFHVLEELASLAYKGKVIVMTAFGTIPSAVKAMKNGAYDYLTKPFDNDLLLHTVARAANHSAVEHELVTTRGELRGHQSLKGIITADVGMKRLFETVERVAPTDMPVLITGESGTGKELFAKAIHASSSRSDGPFVAINCGALPESLIESELFGYKKGAFSGAIANKPGLVEQANNGTLFLDEVGELGANVQVKLLRFLQDSEFISVGDTNTKKVNVRIIAATNRKLEKEVANGSFRQDLFFRLNVIELDLPPLRKRMEDIPLLLDFFVNKHGTALGRSDVHFDASAISTLCSHHWPGNVRELENAVKRILVLNSQDLVVADVVKDILGAIGADAISVTDKSLGDLVADTQEQLERKKILRALADNDGNRTWAAKALGIGRNTLLRKLKKYDIN